MPNFLYFHPDDNVATRATITAQTGTENALYPLTCLTDFSYATIAKPSKLNEVTGAWMGNFGSAQRVDYAMFWHNFQQSLAVSFQMHASNAWGSPTVSQALTVPARRLDNYTVKVGLDLRAVSGYSTGGFQYFRVNVSGSNNVPIGLKMMLFSQVRQLDKDFQLSDGIETVENPINILMASDAGVPWAYGLSSNPRTLRGKGLWSDADAVRVRDWQRSCQGRVKPTVIVREDGEPWLVRFLAGQPESSPTLTGVPLSIKRGESGNTMNLSFDEVPAGDPEWY